jgi:hypothetical protein
MTETRNTGKHSMLSNKREMTVSSTRWSKVAVNINDQFDLRSVLDAARLTQTEPVVDGMTSW